MEDLIERINQLQEVFHLSGYKGIDLPQVVVVGSQSSGKSSVLEHLVGRSFLPRGTGIVTRCPLILQMRRIASDEEYAIFQHDTSRVFTDFSLITREIEEQTDVLAGSNKGIRNTPIILKLFSSSFVDLTLVDLPGLTKVPVGDQPQDIEDQTRSLIMEYVQNPNSIILAVTPGNTDLATSDSLKISRDVDPEGKRTLAVVTKLDIMDEGTNAKDMLCGQVIPVKLGIIGVVNRSQKDVSDGKSIEDSLVDEAAFFQKRYPSIAEQHGTAYLTKTVQKILMNHIKSCLPEIREKIHQQLGKQQEELQLIGDGTFDHPTVLLDFMRKFSNIYCSTINGNLTNIETTELCGGARINRVFKNTFNSALESIDALEGLSKSHILTALQNAIGVSPALFIPMIAFQLLVKKQIHQLRLPCIQCVELIHEELNMIGKNCLIDPELGVVRFPRLKIEMEEIVNDLLGLRVSVTKEMVNHFIDVQLAYINTSHPDFVTNQSLCGNDANVINITENESVRKMKKHSKSVVQSSSDSDSDLSEDHQTSPSSSRVVVDKDNENYILIQELIKNYFSIVRLSIQDTIPKVIMNFLVNYIMDHLQSQLVERLYGRIAEGILEESSEVTDKRARLFKSITTLKKATQVLNSISSSHNLPSISTSSRGRSLPQKNSIMGQSRDDAVASLKSRESFYEYLIAKPVKTYLNNVLFMQKK